MVSPEPRRHEKEARLRELQDDIDVRVNALVGAVIIARILLALLALIVLGGILFASWHLWGVFIRYQCRGG